MMAELEPDDDDEGPPETAAEKKKRRSRQNFSWTQLSVLERVFETDPLPRQCLLLELSNRLDITPRCVQVWFQNRRQKFKAMHHAMGQVPPPLKNASSRLTSLESLLPDLGPEPPRITSAQLRESAPKVRRILPPPLPATRDFFPRPAGLLFRLRFDAHLGRAQHFVTFVAHVCPVRARRCCKCSRCIRASARSRPPPCAPRARTPREAPTRSAKF